MYHSYSQPTESINCINHDPSALFRNNQPQAHEPSLIDMLNHFPDLPLFISHQQFPTFLRLWHNFQKQIELVKEPRQRILVSTWLKLSISEIEQTMVLIHKMDSDAIFLAFQQLKERMEIMCQMIEMGWFNPSQAMGIIKPDMLSENFLFEDCLQPALYIPTDLEPQNTCFWSLPNTPSIEQPLVPLVENYQQFISLPPTIISEQNPPLISLPTTPAWTEDSFMSTEIKPESEEESEVEEDLNDEDYVASLAEEELEEESYRPKRKRRMTQRSSSSQARRTATSYDAKTTHYLKSVFFDIYSVRDKLTKEQRRKVQKDTGLKPRNITYWFSNHKRRFQSSLVLFRKTVHESKGKIKTYHEFLKYRKDRGLSSEEQ
ncbi:hypothetical protein G6F56_001554 [Rhizopus delemar]|nr:hypothetical protein G6F56_001554 [Rhizopus delemar]